VDPRLLNAFDAGHAIVTATPRLARFVRLQLARTQRERGVPAWTPPVIVAFDGWLAREHEAVRWSAGGSARALLNGAQEACVWEQIVAADADAGAAEPAATARQARAAWGLVHAWRLPDPARAPVATDEVRAFGRWMRAYHERCTKEGWLDRARLPDALRVAWSAGVIPPPPGLLMLGFEQLTPQQRALLRQLEKCGTRVELARGPRESADVQRMEFASAEQELYTAARWARHLLAAGAAERIGILVPRLAARREGVQRVLDDVLSPGAGLPGRAAPRRPYNLAAARALASQPAVRGARAVLALLRGRMPLDEVSHLLRTPFIAGGLARAPQRALFDAWLREQGVAEIDFDRFPRYLAAFTDSRRSHPADVALHAPFERARAALPEEGARAPVDVWAQAARRCLQAFGWPGERKLDADECECVAALDAVLFTLASLELVHGPVDGRGALRRLAGVLARESLRTESHDAPIQVLDVADAYGLAFDALWITGLDDDAWPPPASPNPFIPIEWQRAQGVPGATADAQLAMARRVTHRLVSASRRVLLSHAMRDGERSRGASPLVRAVPLRADAGLELAQATDYRGVLLGAAALETLRDECAPPLAPAEPVRGGARVLVLQAACPFRAFGELRLGARALAVAAPGLDRRARGTLLHAALERLWRALGSSAALRDLDEAGRARVAALAAEGAVAALELERMTPLSPQRRALETRRIERALRDWLAVEADRAEFVVRDLETQRAVRVGGLDLVTRADRVDRLPDGAVVIIDYKTGAAERRAPACWSGDRPDEPQIPLYAVAEQQPLGAVLLAHVRPGRSGFSGLARDGTVAPGVAPADAAGAPDLARLRTEWRATLDALAVRFASGEAQVDPRHGPQTCRLCDLASLCRVAESREARPVAVDD
jgi:ATP-dependent helicase/nuclease subunit B